jgi:putative transposase
LSRAERIELLENGNIEMSLQEQCDLLTLNRTSLYYHPVGPSAEELMIKRRIDEIYTAHPYYGSRRITVELKKEIPISRPTVQRYMREMAIAGVCPGPNLSKRNLAHSIYPYLLRNLAVKRPNQVWGIDITYIRLRTGWMYLVAVLDWYSRYVVSWELEQSLEIGFVLRAVDKALDQARPEICNSDQGSHFTSQQYIALLKAADVKISMDGKGRALDNIFTERLWRTIKYEEVYLKEYGTPRETRQGLGSYLNFYNQERPHQSLRYRTPAEVYRLPIVA